MIFIYEGAVKHVANIVKNLFYLFYKQVELFSLNKCVGFMKAEQQSKTSDPKYLELDLVMITLGIYRPEIVNMFHQVRNQRDSVLLS